MKCFPQNRVFELLWSPVVALLGRSWDFMKWSLGGCGVTLGRALRVYGHFPFSFSFQYVKCVLMQYVRPSPRSMPSLLQWTVCSLELWTKINPLSLKLCLSRYFITTEWDSVSPWSPGWPGTHYLDHEGPKLSKLHASASQVLGLKALYHHVWLLIFLILCFVFLEQFH